MRVNSHGGRREGGREDGFCCCDGAMGSGCRLSLWPVGSEGGEWVEEGFGSGENSEQFVAMSLIKPTILATGAEIQKINAKLFQD